VTEIVAVRPFSMGDLDAVARFAARVHAVDPSVEPFAHRLGVIATGPRARLELWQVAEDERGETQGIAFAALREGGSRTTLDAYVAVAPELRRQGLACALFNPAMRWVLSATDPVVLRVRVRDDSEAGRAFLSTVGFREVGAQLSLHWSGQKAEVPPMPALRILRVGASDARARRELERLSNEAWRGAPDAFATRPDELEQLFSDENRWILLAEKHGRAVGYLSAVWLARTLGIEEVAVLQEYRRAGIGRALVAHALREAASAVLSVAESNRAARALYRSLGFVQASRRIVYETRGGPERG
jgi:ribosomal protein S18 acetylase RimI-like enzyme